MTRTNLYRSILEQYQLNKKRIYIHLLIWLSLLIVNLLFIVNYQVEVNYSFHILTWLIYLSVFYINFFILMPYLFFRRQFLYYTLGSILLIVVFVAIKGQLDHHRMKQAFAMEQPIRPGGHFVPGEGKPPPIPPGEQIKPPDEGKRPPFFGPRGFRPFHFSFYGIIVFYFASFSFRFIQKWQDDEKHTREIEKEKISTELSFLKQQVNPHFLFNALNSIYSMTINTSKPASEALLKLSSILRHMLYETENKLVNLGNEIAIIGDYIDLQKMRLTENVNVSYSITGKSHKYKIAPFLLLPLIENTFKHGVNNVKKSFIEIMIRVHNGELELHTRNSIFSGKKQEERSSGIGIKNIKRRLDLLYPGNYLLDIDESDDIFKLTLKIKLEE